MRIDLVTADAFGPFRRGELKLAPGMTVVHGPNEAGKSSWYAALLSGLTGRRRLRGRGTVDQRRFKERHKPWHHSAWAVGVLVTLDDGRRLRFTRNLNTGDTAVSDATSGQRLSVQQLEHLEHEGSIDGSRLFGLNRDSAQATVFAAQADVLRVFQDADELQELLQRAAATTTVDTTVEAALSWIEEERRVRVGQPNMGQRPLRAAQRELDEARQSADQARDAYDALQELLVARRRAQVDLAGAEQDLQQLASATRWLDVERLADRVRKARELTAQVGAAQSPAPADPSSLRSVTELLAGYRDRGAAPVPPEGSTVHELRDQLAQLPAPPEGDTSPDPSVTAAYEELRDREVELAAHLLNMPRSEQAPKVAASAEELRTLAAAMEEPCTAADSDLADRVEHLRAAADQAQSEHARAVLEHAARAEGLRAARAQYDAELSRYEQQLAAHEEAMEDYRRRLDDVAAQARAGSVPPPPVRQRQSGLLVAGGVLLLLAVLLAAVGASPVATAAAAAGLVLLVLGVRGREVPQPPPVPTAPPPFAPPPTPPVRPQPPNLTDPGPMPAAPVPDPALAQAEAALALEKQTEAARVRARDQALARTAELGCTADALELRRLAVLVDGQAARDQAVTAWTEREAALRQARETASATLLALLGPRVDASEGGEPIALYQRYAEECVQRAELAQAAARRTDLEEALRLQEQADARHQSAVAQHTEAAQRVLDAWTQLAAIDGEADRAAAAGPDAAALCLQAWVDEQEPLREAQTQARQLTSALEQVLDGSALVELEAQLAAAEQEAGPRPDVPLEELEPRLREVQRRREKAAEAVHAFGGQATAQREMLPSVAAAVEREAQAERRLAQVQQLGALLELTADALGAAKDKVNANIAPVLTARIRPWLPQVTGGRYSDLRVDPETLMVHVREPSGDYREATVLSHGTMEQVYLLLRLALADLLSTNDESAPVVLDDVTVQSDRVRTEALLDLLHQISLQRQVVLFSQEDEVLGWAERVLTGERDRLVSLLPS